LGMEESCAQREMPKRNKKTIRPLVGISLFENNMQFNNF